MARVEKDQNDGWGESRPPQSGQTVTQSQPSQTGSRSISPVLLPTIPLNAPAGLITVTKPLQQSTSYYKIAPNEPITFAWNFSNIIVTPTHLTISAGRHVIWDTYTYQTLHPQLPLAQANYTLKIWGDQGPNAQRAPGFLTHNSAVQFALYTPQAYTPISSGWACTGCSGAISHYPLHPTLVGLIVTFLSMFLSGSLVVRRS